MDEEEGRILGRIEGTLESLETSNTAEHNEMKQTLKDIKECQIEQGKEITTINQEVENHLSTHRRDLKISITVFSGAIVVIATLMKIFMG